MKRTTQKDPPRRRIYRLWLPIVMVPLIVVAFYALYGFSTLTGKQKLILLMGAALPFAFLLLLSFRLCTVLTNHEIRLRYAFHSVRIPLSAVEDVSIRRYGFAGNLAVVLRANGRDWWVPGPGPSVFGRKSSNRVIAEINARRSLGTST